MATYDYDFHTYSVRRRRSKGKIVFSFLGVISVVALLFWFITGISAKENKEETQQNTEVLSAEAEVTPEIDSNTLGAVVQQALLGSTASYAVVIKNLKTGESYSLNQHTVYESGSLYKLWVMAVAFNQIKSGQLKE